MLTTTFKTADAAAHAVLESSALQNASARPYNPFDPRSTWWVMPTKKFPAYHLGKFQFVTDWPGVDGMFVGLNLEKGFDSAVKELAKTGAEKRMLMESDWIWKTAIEEVAGSNFRHACDEMQAATDNQLLIRVFGYAWKIADSAPYDGDSAVTSFAYDGGNLSMLADLSSPAPGIIAGVDAATGLPELVDHLARIPNPDWTWLCLHVGQVFAQSDTESAGDNWDGNRIWSTFLKPMHPWFR